MDYLFASRWRDERAYSEADGLQQLRCRTRSIVGGPREWGWPIAAEIALSVSTVAGAESRTALQRWFVASGVRG